MGFSCGRWTLLFCVAHRYVPKEGKFAGQLGYGYRSIEAFIDAVRVINDGRATPADFDASLPTIGVCSLCG